jgi:phosphatidylglycerol:prolipoprotein diacylglycerol transferase
VLDAGLAALGGGLLGGRVAYVAMSWPYFRQHLAEAPQIGLGGLSWVGAAMGGLLGLLVYARLRRQSPAELLDGLLPLATTVSIAAWLASWVEGGAYGPAVTAFWALPSRDEWGNLASRLPVQLLGALLTLVLLGLVDAIQARGKGANLPGRAAGLWMAGFALLMAGLSTLRADPAPVWAGVRLETWGAACLLVMTTLPILKLKVRN